MLLCLQVVVRWIRSQLIHAWGTWLEFSTNMRAVWEAQFLIRRVGGHTGARVDIRLMTRQVCVFVFISAHHLITYMHASHLCALLCWYFLQYSPFHRHTRKAAACLCCCIVGYLSFRPAENNIMLFVTSAHAQHTEP